MTRALGAAVLVMLVLGACGGEPSGVTVGEAPPVVLAPPPSRTPVAARDTVYADTLQVSGSDSAAVAADTLAVRPEPDEALEALQRAVRDGRRSALTTLAPDVPATDLDLLWVLVESGPFRDGLLALAPRDLRRDGSARTARVVVGYDAAGQIVPQDEAETDRALAVRFDAVDGVYRIVGVDVP